MLPFIHIYRTFVIHPCSYYIHALTIYTLSLYTYTLLYILQVFPWILKDYTSPILDLRDPSVYRDLSKPMGALDPVRLRHFQERYANFDTSDSIPFLYGMYMYFILYVYYTHDILYTVPY